MPESRFDFTPYKMPKDLPEKVLEKVKTWYIVQDARWEGSYLHITVPSQYGQAYEGLTAFIDGVRIALPTKERKTK